MLRPVPWIVSVISALDLMAAPAWAGKAAPAPSPSPSADPLTMLDPSGVHALAERCKDLVKDWAEIRGTARHELATCQLHRFNEACLKLAEARKKAVAPDSPCMKLGQTKDLKLTEINCTVVQVPKDCGGK